MGEQRQTNTEDARLFYVKVRLRRLTRSRGPRIHRPCPGRLAIGGPGLVINLSHLNDDLRR